MMNVIFKQDAFGVIAVFPDQMLCYSHIGQHSAYDNAWYKTTIPAEPDVNLLNELILAGYDNLCVKNEVT